MSMSHRAVVGYQIDSGASVSASNRGQAFALSIEPPMVQVASRAGESQSDESGALVLARGEPALGRRKKRRSISAPTRMILENRLVRRIAFKLRNFATVEISILQHGILEELHRQRRHVEQTEQILRDVQASQVDVLNGLETQLAQMSARFESLERLVEEELDDAGLNARLEEILSVATMGARRVAFYAGSDLGLFRTQDGYVVVPTTEFEIAAMMLETGGDLEPGVRKNILSRLELGDCFIDVGANIGIHTLAAAHRVGPRGRVIAFEPNPTIGPVLETTVTINGVGDRVTVVPVALGDSDGEAMLWVARNSTLGTLWPEILGDGITAEQALATYSIPVRRLTSIIEPHQGGVVIKIDVEGSEFDVLRGIDDAFVAEYQPVFIVEVCPSRLTARGSSLTELLDWFVGRGYSGHRVDPLTGELEEFASLVGLVSGSENVLFAPIEQ